MASVKVQGNPEIGDSNMMTITQLPKLVIYNFLECCLKLDTYIC